MHLYLSFGQTAKVPVLRSTSNIPDTRKNKVYRCCLPTLTGFTRSRHPEAVISTRSAGVCRCPSCLVGGFNPAIADCRLQATANRPSSTAEMKIPNRLRPRKPDHPETETGTVEKDPRLFLNRRHEVRPARNDGSEAAIRRISQNWSCIINMHLFYTCFVVLRHSAYSAVTTSAHGRLISCCGEEG